MILQKRRLKLIGIPEKYFILTGRPNAGKSSIIREILALDVITGKRPGTTKYISKYLLSNGLVLVDLPGFGRMLGSSKRLEKKINDQIIKFLESNAQRIVLAVHVLDISNFLAVTQRLEKKGFISVDIEMVHLLEKTLNEFPLVAANKIDKTDKENLKVNLDGFLYKLNNGYTSVYKYVFPVSAKTGEGLGVLKTAIHERLVKKGYKTPFTKR